VDRNRWICGREQKTVEKKEEERSLKKKGNHFELEQFQFSERQSECEQMVCFLVFV